MYKDVKVLIFGLGLNDGGLGMAQFFLEQGAILTITDGKTQEELQEPLSKLSQYSNIMYHLGGHIESDFTDNDIIVRNPAIKPDNPYLEIARKAGKEIVMEMALFCKLTPTPVIGITGTKGKSTTTTLIYEIFKSVYGEKVLLGGNIGKSAIRELSNLSENMLSVLEISSAQLDGMGESKISPHVSVVTNIYEDHINWHGSMKEYIQAKKSIFLNQKENDYLVVNYDNHLTYEFIDEAKSNVLTFSLDEDDCNYYMDEDLNVYENEKLLLRLENLKLEGKHNLYNILGAIATARIYNISVENIKKVVENFTGVPNRQEYVREVDGVRYYNDTTATSVESMLAMFERFGEKNKGKIVMIAGGVDKGMDYRTVSVYMKKYLKALVLLEGTASEKMFEFVGDSIPVYHYFNNMRAAIDQARELAESGDMIILSPGGSSFNMFVNEFDRGNQFVEYVNSL
jgi:UDP-N-acetylmuramoylalanine--D-glutamate ligase